jgi:16S rRNA (cytidine1402-2'-O)-methyltransferase
MAGALYLRNVSAHLRMVQYFPPMPGTLFVVATPIGNLEDITLRALRVLREASVIAAEDTRRTAKLLAHYAISTPSISFHEHNTRSRLPQLLARLQQGETVALVSDAGTPGISDPGLDLIQACWDHGVSIDPVPGPSAPIAAAAASGFPLEPLTIYGFAPSRSKDREKWLTHLQTVEGTFTFFETPHRIEQTLALIPMYFGDRPIMVARELTKRHQQLLRFDSAEDIGLKPEKRGEFTVVVGERATPRSRRVPASEDEIYLAFCRMTADEACGRRAAVSAVARNYGVSAKKVYSIVERLKVK